jgi:hypothetical protein
MNKFLGLLIGVMMIILGGCEGSGKPATKPSETTASTPASKPSETTAPTDDTEEAKKQESEKYFEVSKKIATECAKVTFSKKVENRYIDRINACNKKDLKLLIEHATCYLKECKKGKDDKAISDICGKFYDSLVKKQLSKKCSGVIIKEREKVN